MRQRDPTAAVRYADEPRYVVMIVNLQTQVMHPDCQTGSSTKIEVSSQNRRFTGRLAGVTLEPASEKIHLFPCSRKA